MIIATILVSDQSMSDRAYFAHVGSYFEGHTFALDDQFSYLKISHRMLIITPNGKNFLAVGTDHAFLSTSVN